jgi:hypothetical protein
MVQEAVRTRLPVCKLILADLRKSLLTRLAERLKAEDSNALSGWECFLRLSLMVVRAFRWFRSMHHDAFLLIL